MATIDYEKKYNKEGILIGLDNWIEWNGTSGTNVQAFIKGQLENSIVDIEYDSSSSTLIGKNAFNVEVSSAEVIVATPNYRFKDGIETHLYLNGSNSEVTGSVKDINATSNLTAILNFNWNLVQTINVDTEYSTRAINYKVYLCDLDGSPFYNVGKLELIGKANYTKEGFNLDISKLLSKDNTGTGLSCKIKIELDYSFKDSTDEITSTKIETITSTTLNLKRIEVSYPTNAELLRSPIITFNVSGVDSTDASNFSLQYNAIRVDTQLKVTGSIPLNKEDTSLISLNLESITGVLSGTVCPVNLCVRVTNSSFTLYSDYCTVSALYQSSDTSVQQIGGFAAISYVPTTVSNCDSANLFNIVTTDLMQGDLTIYVYRDSSSTVLNNLTTTNTNSTYYYKNTKANSLLFKTISVNLSGIEKSEILNYYSYLELDNLSSGNNKIYLAFVIESGSNAYVSQFLVASGSGSVNISKAREITIINPSNVSLLTHINTNKIIDYSQIQTNKTFNQNGVMKELFSLDNLHENIDSTDGTTLDGKYLGFKVSPLGTKDWEDGDYLIKNGDHPDKVPINLFKEPISLRNNNNVLLPSSSGFSIELLIKTYNVNDDNDFILSIGNLRLYPHYLRLWSKDEGYDSSGSLDFSFPYMASCANFSKDEITHIMITFDKKYKPTRYEKTVFLDLYPGYSNSVSNNGPEEIECLKIYINGTINRSIAINSDLLLDDYGNFALQIHPSNSNINTYIFRTYSVPLQHEEIIKNRISAYSSLESEKLPYLDKNDILYSSIDYTNDRWYELAEAGLLNTISIRKCLNISDSGYVDKNKKYSLKNVMLMVVGDEGPLYYGNKKFGTKGENKKHDAAMFIKYAPINGISDTDYYTKYNGKFIGKRLVGETGYDAYYKAQGTSAKKYGGAYNVQFSKFNFIPESNLNNFANLVDNKFYDETAANDNTIIEVNEEGASTQYKTGTLIDFTTNKNNETILNGYAEMLKKFSTDSYDIPGEQETKIQKLVGKVNYASSMQSHKQGACDLYANCYPDKDNDYMIRRAVKEDVFYYFYIKLSDCIKLKDQEEVNFRNVTWDNINFDKVRFFGIQTWGSAKMDKPTFGLNSKKDLEYICIEGADNKNLCTNFKNPWAAMQIWDPNQIKINDPYYTLINTENYIHQYSGKVGSTPDYITGLLIDDETIRYKEPSSSEKESGSDAVEKGPDAWDIAGNAIEEVDGYSNYYDFKSYKDTSNNTIQPAKTTLSKFAEFSNAIYTFDFGNLELLDMEESLFNLKRSTSGINISKKYIVPMNNSTIITDKKTYTNVNSGDVFRWDQLQLTFVPAGLYYGSDDWESFNVGTIYEEAIKAVKGNTSIYKDMYNKAVLNFSNYLSKPTIFTKPDSLLSMSGDMTKYFSLDTGDVSDIINQLSIINNREENLNIIKGAFADMFKCVIWAYCDINSFTYHQAAIRFLSGTDNRAKNIYFVIKGAEYKQNADKTYTVVDNSDSKYLITLFLDDLDTIFATDNNGQQAKDYNLLEPIYNNETINYWGDSRSGLWYNFDLVFEDQIKYHLKRIIDWAISEDGGDGVIYNTENNLYKYFLKIQNEIIPPVTYNHMSEIYYDVMQTVYSKGLTNFGLNTAIGFKDGLFNNNLVSNPMSLVHGSCFESEKLFLKKRIALLASYCTSFTSEDSNSKVSPKGNTGGGDETLTYMKVDNLSFIQDFYPNIVGKSINDISIEKRKYADPFVLSYNPPKYISSLSKEGDSYDIERFVLTSDLTSRDSIEHTDYFKSITFREGASSVDTFAMNNVSELRYEIPDENFDDDSTNNIGENLMGINFVPINSDLNNSILYMHKIVKNVEILDVPYSKFTKSTIDLSLCQRLKELNLSYATSTTSLSDILLPRSNKLSRIILPSDISRVSIEYYPGITHFNENTALPENERTWFKFDSNSVKLTSITIDFRNSWALEFLEKYAISGIINNVVIKNLPKEITIKASLLNILLNIKSFDFDSNIKLNIIGTVDIDMKQKMAYKWGNIDSSSNKVYCVYNLVHAVTIDVLDTSPVIEKTGDSVGIKIKDENGNDANDIAIITNKLNIQYTLYDYNGSNIKAQGVDVDKYTGIFTVPTKITTGTQGRLLITATTMSGSSLPTTEVIISFGAYEPKVGDIVYSDGSIGSSLNTNKTPVAFVFWSKEISNTSSEKLLDLRLLSFSSLKNVTTSEESSGANQGLPFGPCGTVASSDFDGYNSYGSMTKEAQTIIVNILKNNPTYGFGTFKASDDNNNQNSIGSNAFTKAPTSSYTTIKTSSLIPDTINENENLYCGYYTTKVIHDYVYSDSGKYIPNIINREVSINVLPITDKTSYDTAYQLLQYNNSVVKNLGCLLFPAFIKTFEWYPSGVDADNEEIGSGKWYVPSVQEYSYLIREKLLQLDTGTISGKTYEDQWNVSGINFYLDSELREINDNVFRTLLTNMNATTLDKFSSIGIDFISSTINKLKSSTFVSTSYNNSVSGSGNNVYVYQTITNYSDSTYSWNSSVSSSAYYGYGTIDPALSEKAIVYPCCRIIKSIPK